MVVYDFDLIRFTLNPCEADAVLVVDIANMVDGPASFGIMGTPE
jgi:hypothetical protein